MSNLDDLNAKNGSNSSVIPDSLSSNVELPLRKVFYPLGFSVEIATNSQAVLQAAEESWGCFQKTFIRSTLQIRICVSEGGTASSSSAPTYRTQGSLLSVISDAENFAICDLRQGFACAWLTSGTVECRNYLRYHFLEAVAMCLLASLHVTPIHAACVALSGCGFLLCGDSGAGKSSLAFACARAGWTYISDDASYLIRSRSDRFVAGNSHQIRFRPSTAGLFPELKGLDITPRAAGKPSIEVSTSSLMADMITASGSRIDYVIFLNREGLYPPELMSFSRLAAEQHLKRYFWGSDEIQEGQITSLRKLLTADIFELRYCNLDWAVNRLETLVREEKQADTSN
jgi:hypothetical protein